MAELPAAPLRSIQAFVRWARGWWATRSLAAGAVATVLDVSTLVVCVEWLHFPNPLAAMTGVTVGATFTFFANRHFAFKDHTPALAPQALRFAASTGAAMLVHAFLVWILADHLHIEVVIAKLMADIAVFSVGQLLVLRYFVFPAAKPGAPKPSGQGLSERARTSSPS